jgi:hypothetical protein
MRPRVPIGSLPVALLLLSGSCAAERGAPRPGAVRADPAANTLKFRVWRCMDEGGIGGEVFRMLVPADWKAEGKVAWRLEAPMAPAAISFRIWNPNGPEAMEGFPNLPLFWSDNRGLIGMFPPGSKYFGAEVHRPLAIEDALQRIVAARFRKGLRSASIVEIKPLPAIVKALGLEDQSPGGGVRFSATAGKVRMDYALDGKEYTEDLIGVRESLMIPVQSMSGTFTNDNWTLSFLVGMRAAKGGLDAQSKLFTTMAASVQLNKEWFNRYVQLVELLIRAQVQRIRMTGEFSRILSQTSAEISDDRMKLYERRQGAYDRVSESFSDYMRDIDRYTDADGATVELPSGYKNAWVNGLGEYIVADSDSYNPNVGSNQNWQPLKRK